VTCQRRWCLKKVLKFANKWENKCKGSYTFSEWHIWLPWLMLKLLYERSLYIKVINFVQNMIIIMQQPETWSKIWWLQKPKNINILGLNMFLVPANIQKNLFLVPEKNNFSRYKYITFCFWPFVFCFSTCKVCSFGNWFLGFNIQFSRPNTWNNRYIHNHPKHWFGAT
jgi:hypothetical protein